MERRVAHVAGTGRGFRSRLAAAPQAPGPKSASTRKRGGEGGETGKRVLKDHPHLLR